MLIPRSSRIDGSATFTTVLSSMIMNRPTATAASVHHFRFSVVKSLALTLQRLENSYASPRGGVRLDADAGAGRERKRHAARAAARRRALSRPPPHLDRGARALLARSRRGPGAGVLRAVDGRRRRLARARVGDVVRRRKAESRLELRAPLGRRRARGGRGGRVAGRRRRARHADVARAVGRGVPAPGGARGGWERAPRPGRGLPARVAA